MAAAYYLSFRLRFDAGVPEKYDRLFDATIVWVVVAALVVFTLLRLEVKQWRYTGHRDYLGVVEAVAATTLVARRVHRHRPPGDRRVARRGAVAVTAPTGVLVLFFLLTLALRRRGAVRRAHRLRGAAARHPRRARAPAAC